MKCREMCVGCKDDYYNRVRPNGCWSFEGALVVGRLMIHRDAPPPYDRTRVVETLSCWYGETGMRAVDPVNVTSEGYWR